MVGEMLAGRKGPQEGLLGKKGSFNPLDAFWVLNSEGEQGPQCWAALRLFFFLGDSSYLEMPVSVLQVPCTSPASLNPSQIF